MSKGEGNIRDAGKNIKWGRVVGDGNFREENQGLKNGWEEYQVVENFSPPNMGEGKFIFKSFGVKYKVV